MSSNHTPIGGIIFIALSLLFAGCGKVTPSPTATALPLTASLSEVQGQVQLKNPDQADFTSAVNGVTVQVQGQVRTGGDGRVRLDLSNKSIIRLAFNTNFTLVSNQPQQGGLLTRIKLETGRIWIALSGGSIDVETPSGLASVRGSDIMVWIDPVTLNVYVDCFEGDCGAANTADQSLNLYTGQGAILYHVETGSVPPPPEYRVLTWQEFQDWVQNNPEAQQSLPDIIATLTAIPTATPSHTASPASTSTSTPTPTPTFTAIPTATSTAIPTSTSSPTLIPSATKSSSSSGAGFLPPLSVPKGSEISSVAQQGGRLGLDHGKLVLTIPPGAVSERVVLIQRDQNDLPVTNFTPIYVYTLEAYTISNGWHKYTDFNKPVTIQVSYSPKQVDGIDENALGLYYFDNELNQWVALPSVVDAKAGHVTVNRLDYFPVRATLYALMAPARATAP